MKSDRSLFLGLHTVQLLFYSKTLMRRAIIYFILFLMKDLSIRYGNPVNETNVMYLDQMFLNLLSSFHAFIL